MEIAEHSTGCHHRVDAEAVAAAEEAQVRDEQLSGAAGREWVRTIDDCFVAYLKRPGGVKPYDAARVRAFSDLIGGEAIGRSPEAWHRWLAAHGGIAPATAARWRATLQAAITYGCRALDVKTAPRLETIRQPREQRVVYLTGPERERLLAAYSRPANYVALMLAYQGLRTQEALRLDWRDVRLAQGTVRVAHSKTGKARAVPLHPRAAAMLACLANASGHPEVGTVFLSRRGAPYADTRQTGGNPLHKAHLTACRRAGITGFRVHDWRHDWAARMVMSGADLVSLMRLGGWSSLKMVERYASVSAEHLRDAISRLA